MSRGRPIWLPIAVFLLLGTAVVLTWSRFRETDRRAATEQLQLVAEQSAERLQDCVRSRFLVLGVVRDELAAGVTADRASFAERTIRLEQQFEGFQAINWMDAAGIIRWASPERPNRGALGRDVHAHPVAGPVLRLAEQTGRPSITPPLQLFQGGRGFTSYWPVHDRDGAIRGFVNGVFRTEPLVRVALGGTLAHYRVRIQDGPDPIFSNADAARAETDAPSIEGHAEMEIAERRWTVHVSPGNAPLGAQRLGDHLPFLGGGLGMALALALVLGTVLERDAQRRRALEERRQLERQLGDARKMEAVGRLAGAVAHDFNNLVTAILGGAELVLRADGVGASERAHLEQIVATCERAAQLTGQLLAVSRPRHPLAETAESDLAAEVASVEPLLARLAREDVTIEMRIDSVEGVVALAPGQVAQVLLNLFVNANDAMSRGGPVRILTRGSATGPSGEPGSWAILTVRDRGEGMDEATRARVFEPFFTTKGDGKGTGLGLSTVYGIVAAAGGEIRLTTEPGVGSCFDVWLPTHPPRRAPPDAPGPSPGPLASAKPLVGNVLVVEDQPDVRAITSGILRRAGLAVVEATDGEHALALVDAGLKFDWVVTDAVMPRLGGLELLRCLRASHEDFGAVLASGYASDLEASDLQAVGAVFLPKPFGARALLEALERSRPDPDEARPGSPIQETDP